MSAVNSMSLHSLPAGSPLAHSPQARERLLRMLYHKHARALHTFVMGLVASDRQRAEDIVQETMLRAWQNADQLDEQRPSLRPWLFTVARRLVIDAHRRRGTRAKESGSEGIDRSPIADEVDQLLSSLVVREALHSLSPAHQAVLREIYFYRSKVADAAKTLGIPPGTVKSRTYYALKALRLALEERGVTSEA
jgi:RNA polymerase sigma-70 factor, ECF subfamily